MPSRAPFVDTHGRVVRDLRISVTDRCNLRCVYCMPAEGMPWLPREELLTYEELARFARVCVECGVRGIRLTGGKLWLDPDTVQNIVRLHFDDPAASRAWYEEVIKRHPGSPWADQASARLAAMKTRP